MSGKWYVCPQPNPTAPARLICFPHAGGGTPTFTAWPGRLPAVEVWIASLPGRGTRLHEAPLTEMLPLVQALAREFMPLADRPFFFFGHSLGGRLAFELARSLRRQGKPLPQRLFVSASPAPHLPRTRPPIHTLPKAAFLEEMRRRGGTPDEVLAHPDLVELLLPALRADFTLYETSVYTSEPLLECPITAFGGVSDPLVDRTLLAAWEAQTAVAFRLQMFLGNHFFLNTAVVELMHALRTELPR